MKATQRRFVARVLTICMGLVTFLLLDAAISGTLGLAGAICLIPASAFVTNVLWQLSLRKVRKRGHVARARHLPAAPSVPAERAPAPQPAAALPTLYVVSGGKPDGTTEPPNVA